MKGNLLWVGGEETRGLGKHVYFFGSGAVDGVIADDVRRSQREGHYQ